MRERQGHRPTRPVGQSLDSLALEDWSAISELNPHDEDIVSCSEVPQMRESRPTSRQPAGTNVVTGYS